MNIHYHALIENNRDLSFWENLNSLNAIIDKIKINNFIINKYSKKPFQNLNWSINIKRAKNNLLNLCDLT